MSIYFQITWIVLSLGCLWIAVWPKIPTGFLTTTGLCLLSFGNLASIDPESIALRSYQFRLAGAVMILFGVFWRFGIKVFWLKMSAQWRAAHIWAKIFGIEQRSGCRGRRSSDHLEETP